MTGKGYIIAAGNNTANSYHTSFSDKSILARIMKVLLPKLSSLTSVRKWSNCRMN